MKDQVLMHELVAIAHYTLAARHILTSKQCHANQNNLQRVSRACSTASFLLPIFCLTLPSDQLRILDLKDSET